MKELEECSFAPIIYTKKNQKKKTVDVAKKVPVHDQYGNEIIQEQNEYDEYYEEEDDQKEVRNINQFVEDQNKFLQQKRAKEELRKAQQLEQEEQNKTKVPKVNKKSVMILRQREERLEKERIKENLMKNGIENL